MNSANDKKTGRRGARLVREAVAKAKKLAVTKAAAAVPLAELIPGAAEPVPGYDPVEVNRSLPQEIRYSLDDAAGILGIGKRTVWYHVRKMRKKNPRFGLDISTNGKIVMIVLTGAEIDQLRHRPKVPGEYSREEHGLKGPGSRLAKRKSRGRS